MSSSCSVAHRAPRSGTPPTESRHELGAGQSTAELGVVALQEGDFASAADWFRQSAEILDRAHARLDSPLTKLAAAVPIVAQHRAAVVDMSGAGASGAHVVEQALGEIDLDSLRTSGGRIDPAALAALEPPLVAVEHTLERLQATTDASRSQWLANRATYQLDDFTESIGEHLPTLDQAIDAIRLAPQLLGADTPRTYLVLFTTPSESRGLGGMPGTYAELRIDDGALSLGDVGRVESLDMAAHDAGAVVHGNQDFLQQYGRFGYDGAVGDGRVPQPDDDARLPDRRFDRRRPVPADDRPRRRRGHRHGPERAQHAAALHRARSS